MTASDPASSLGAGPAAAPGAIPGATPGAGDFRRLTGATLVVLAGSGVAVLASLALRMLLARLLSPAALGLLLLAVAAVSVAGGVASLGINLAASREVAALRALGRPLSAARGADPGAGTGAVSGLVGALAWWVAAPLLAGALTTPADALSLAAQMRALAPAVLGLSLGLAALGIYRAYDGVVARAVVRDAGGGLLRVTAVAGAGLAAAGPVALAAAYGAASLASEGAFLLHALGRPRREASGVTRANGTAEPVAGDAGGTLSLRRLAPFAGLEVLGQAQQWFDVLLLALFVTPAELALYALARALTRSLDLARGAASHLFLPSAARAAVTGGEVPLDGLMRRTVGLVLALIAPACAVFLLAPGRLMGLLFGAPYAAAAPLLAILTLAVVLEAVFGFRELVLLGRGREAGVWRLRALCLGVGAALLLVLAPPFGAVGAAWAVVAMQAVRGAGLTLMAGA